MDFRHPVEAVVPGAHGRLLGVLAATTAELSLRTLARLAEVSVAQASRVLPGLVTQGIVLRRDVPPSAQFSLNMTHIAAQPILQLACSRTRALAEIRRLFDTAAVKPISAIAFGSFARGEADENSDIDLVVVRPTIVSEDDPVWVESLSRTLDRIAAITGNSVDVLETAHGEIADKLSSGSELWAAIRRDGALLFGLPLAELEIRTAARHA